MNKIAKNAMTVTTANAIHKKNSTMKCGIASSHLTSHSQRLNGSSRRARTCTG